MEQVKAPVTNLPYSDDPDSDLCEDFRGDHDVSKKKRNDFFTI